MKLLNSALNDFKTIIFIDFEGTQTSQEIIAIGAVKCDIDAKNQVKKTYNGFKVFVKAKNKIGPIITRLTGITEPLLKEQGVSFEVALNKLHKYIGTNLNVKFLSYGSFDLRLVHQTSSLNGMERHPIVQAFNKNNIDFASIFQHYVKSSKHEQLSLIDGLKLFKITPIEGIHDPITDSRNLILLYQACLNNKKILQEEYKKLIVADPHLPKPVAKAITKLVKDGNLNKKEFDKYIEEDV